MPQMPTMTVPIPPTTTDGSGGGACDWATLENQIIAALKRLSEEAEKVYQQLNNFFDELEAAIEKYKDSWWGKIIDTVTAHSISNFIKAVITYCRYMAWQINMTIKAVVWLVPKIMAPWTIRSVGRKMQSQLVSKAETLSNALDPAHMASPKSWDSDGGAQWLVQANNMKTAGGEPTVEGVTRFSDSVTQLGERAVDATVEVVGELTGGITDLVKGLKGMDDLLKALPKMAKNVAIALKIIMLVAAIVKFAYEIASSSMEFKDAASTALSSDWPKPTSR